MKLNIILNEHIFCYVHRLINVCACTQTLLSRIVEAFGKVAIFSLIYVCGAQLSLFNVMSTFGVPFYHIYIRFGLGFVYDVSDHFIFYCFIKLPANQSIIGTNITHLRNSKYNFSRTILGSCRWNTSCGLYWNAK